MSWEYVNLERDGHIATITINRPDRMNALGADVTQGLHEALDELQKDRDVWLVILTGTGRAFSAGGDVAAMGQRIDSGPTRPRTVGDDYLDRVTTTGRALGELSMRIHEFRLPVIGMINGVAAGGGLTVTLSCDLRVAADTARFTAAQIKRGFVPDIGLSYFLPRAVGPAVAAELGLTGRIINAETALRMGIVNKVVPAADLLTETRALAEEILSNPPLSVAMAKKVLRLGLGADIRTALENESVINAVASKTDDWREGVKSFLEKRAPVFQGR
ncbi:MAG: enoyl-CoA hydratase-related protein [Chloroflexi bacterium]|nr:enoyl-CoA hydratase-related protein [Chloroflexota bacterium]